MRGTHGARIALSMIRFHGGDCHFASCIGRRRPLDFFPQHVLTGTANNQSPVGTIAWGEVAYVGQRAAGRARASSPN